MKKIILTLCAVLALGWVNAAEKVEQTYFPASDEQVRIAMQSQEALNEFVAERAVYYYAKINSRFRYPDPGEKLGTNSKFWQTSKEKRIQISTISGTISSEALIDLFNQGGVIECTIAVQLVKNLILLDILGAKTFNTSRDRLLLPGNNDFPTYEVRMGTPQLPGEFGYIANIKDYNKIHPGGIATGENVFCVGPNSYVGFGPFFTVPKSAEEIIEYLYKKTHEPIVGEEDLGLINKQKFQKEYENREYWSNKRKEHQTKCSCVGFNIYLIGRLLSGKVNVIKPTQCLIGQGQLEKLIATFPITEALPCHKELFNQVFCDKSKEQLNDIIAVANSVVGGTIHPYEYYQLLLLAAHFGDRENGLNAFAKTDEKNAASIARVNDLGLYSDEGSSEIINGTIFKVKSGSLKLEVVTREKYLKRTKLAPENYSRLLGEIYGRHRIMTLVSAASSMLQELREDQNNDCGFLFKIDPLQDYWFLGSQTLEYKLEPRNQVQKLAVLHQLLGKLSGLRVHIAELMRGPIKASVYSLFRKN